MTDHFDYAATIDAYRSWEAAMAALRERHLRDAQASKSPRPSQTSAQDEKAAQRPRPSIPRLSGGVLAFGAVLLAALPAYALQQPIPGKADPRIRSVPYKPDQIVELWTQPGAIMEIEFAADESVPEGNVARTDGSKVVANPRGNMLYIKLRGCIDPEPLLVTTKLPNGSLRPYRFQLESRGSDCSEAPPEPAFTKVSDGKPQPQPHQGNLKYVPEGGLAAGADVIYSVRFEYPADEAAKRAAERRARHADDEQRAAQDLLKKQTAWRGAGLDPDNGQRSYRFAARGNTPFAPSSVWSNGQYTTFIFPKMQRVPALFKVDAAGKESTVNFSVHRGDSDGDTIIADSVAQEWRLRDGGSVLEVWDLGYNGIGETTGTGTVSPYVSRVLKGEGAR